MRGKRLGLLDFDLDASGLANIFKVFGDDDLGDASPEELREKLKDLGHKELLQMLEARDLNIGENSMFDAKKLLETRFDRDPDPGRLRVLPTITDPSKSDSIVLNERGGYIGDLFDKVIQRCGVDYLCVDLKPGWSPSFRTVIPRVDRVVIVSRLDEQNRAGLRSLMPELRKEGKDPILVANMIPDDPRSADYVEELKQVCWSGEAEESKFCTIPLVNNLFFDTDFETAAKAESSETTEAELKFREGLEQLADWLAE